MDRARACNELVSTTKQCSRAHLVYALVLVEGFGGPRQLKLNEDGECASVKSLKQARLDMFVPSLPSPGHGLGAPSRTGSRKGGWVPATVGAPFLPVNATYGIPLGTGRVGAVACSGYTYMRP